MLIKDFVKVPVDAVFHFKNSLRPFILVNNNETVEDLFIDINQMYVYTLDELESEGLEFYTKEDDKDFLGVEIDGKIKWGS